jgi:nitroreductase
MEPTMDLYEALYTTRAMRRVRPDAVPVDVLKSMLDAAIRAPSGGNTQNWRFVTITAPEVKQPLGDIYRKAHEELLRTVYQGRAERALRSGDEATLRVMRSAQWLADHFERVPLWILVFSRNDPTGASIFPAVWSMQLAARGHGVGTCLTTILGMFQPAAVFDLLGVPRDKGWQLAAAVSAGSPTGRWGLAERRPVHEVVYQEGWGRPASWTADQPVWGAPES